jgi:L-fucose isomerase-like protein
VVPSKVKMTTLSAPRISLILLRAEWFDSVVALPELVTSVQEDERTIRDFLTQSFEIAGFWVVNSPSSLQACLEEINPLQVDLFILAFQVWAEDFFLKPIVDALAGNPLAVWCYLPWEQPPQPASFTQVLQGSGPVGTFEGLGTLRNLGVKFTFTHGSPVVPRVQRDLEIAARAAQVQRMLRSARFGILPARNEQMQSTFIDEFRLRSELGPQVLYLSVAELARKSASLEKQEVQDYIRHLQEEYTIKDVKHDDLELAARTSLGLAHLAIDHHLDVLSVNDIDPELHETLGLRPCLYPPHLDEHDAALSLEGDLGAATALFILRHLTDSPIFFVEIWYWDEANNVIVGGHAGLQDPRVARPSEAWISHDYEFAQSDRSRGAHYQFITRPGQVTLLQLRGTPQGWQALLVAGEALDGPPRLEGYPHAAVRLDPPIDTFVRRVAQAGSTQHWIMAYGDVRSEVQALCELSSIPLEFIQ